MGFARSFERGAAGSATGGVARRGAATALGLLVLGCIGVARASSELSSALLIAGVLDEGRAEAVAASGTVRTAASGTVRAAASGTVRARSRRGEAGKTTTLLASAVAARSTAGCSARQAKPTAVASDSALIPSFTQRV